MIAAKRQRRTPEEARRLILDAAEASLARSGPAGIRLQEVAEAAGVSHPTILHHFQSREGLIQALNQRTLADLRTALRDVMQAQTGSSLSAVTAAFAAYRRGLAERIVHLRQAQTDLAPVGLTVFEEMVDGLHALRQRHAPPGVALDRADSQWVVHLITITAFGDALLGARLRRSGTPEEDAEAGARFERWLSEVLDEHIGRWWGR